MVLCRKNALTNLHALFQVVNLTSLNVSCNNIDSLVSIQALAKLTDLDVSQNAIKYLPRFFVISVSFNLVFIFCHRNLPPTLSKLQYQSLNLSHNKFRELPFSISAVFLDVSCNDLQVRFLPLELLIETIRFGGVSSC